MPRISELEAALDAARKRRRESEVAGDPAYESPDDSDLAEKLAAAEAASKEGETRAGWGEAAEKIGRGLMQFGAAREGVALHASDLGPETDWGGRKKEAREGLRDVVSSTRSEQERRTREAGRKYEGGLKASESARHGMREEEQGLVSELSSLRALEGDKLRAAATEKGKGATKPHDPQKDRDLLADKEDRLYKELATVIAAGTKRGTLTGDALADAVRRLDIHKAKARKLRAGGETSESNARRMAREAAGGGEAAEAGTSPSGQQVSLRAYMQEHSIPAANAGKTREYLESTGFTVTD